MADDQQLPSWMDRERAVRLDAKSVRALAHPIRLKILGILRTDGSATSTTLADRLGLNTGATSYHLRQLASYGFIVEDTGRGQGRERWWRAAHTMTVFDRETLTGTESGEAYIRSIGQIIAEDIQRATDQYATLPQEWRAAVTFSDTILLLTPAETAQLKKDLWEVLGRYRRHDPDQPASAPADAVPVSVQLQAFPHARAVAGQEGHGGDEDVAE